MPKSNIIGKTPRDFQDQLEVWNYHYNGNTNQFFKYVGMGMLIIDPDWRVAFIFRGKDSKLATYNSKYIVESIEELPWIEAEIFYDLLGVNEPLMLST